jgi:HEAT repeat protein
VRGAKVVTYCSVECADGVPSAKPAPAEAAPVAGIAPAPAAKNAPVTAEPKSATALVQAEGSDSSETARDPDFETPRLARAPTARTAGKRQRKRILVASAAIMLGGMAIAVVQAVSPSTPSSATAGKDERARAAAVGSPAAEPTASDGKTEKEEGLSKVALRSAAVKELRALLQSNSHRVQRMAAMGLARNDDTEALARLVELFDKEESTLAQIDIAFAQARAGVAAGREFLTTQLTSSRRDVRIDAARRLVELGDDSGARALTQMLGVRSHKLGAAALLARLGEEKGTSFLKETLTDESSSDENKMRAAVALGRAGDESARATLQQILSDGRYVVDAAGALARLGDEAAVPALERQLQLTAMRVSAAEALAGMKREVPLDALATALVEGNEEGRVTAAEAILILTAGQQEE